MDIANAARRVAAVTLPPMLFLSLTGYFAWNATRGEYGLATYAVRQRQLVERTADRETAESERLAWEKRVAGLRADHIDADTLDERSRAMLNLADPADVVVPYGPANKLF